MDVETLYAGGLHVFSLTVPLWTSLMSACFWWLATRRGKIALAVLVSMLAFGLLDLAMFKSLPYWGLSFGPARFPFAFLTMVRGLLTTAGAALLVVYLVLRMIWTPGSVPRRSSALYWVVPLLINLGISGGLFNGLFIEPLAVQVERVDIASERLRSDAPPVRLVHLSDTHIERLTLRERRTVEWVNELQPDLIVLTGDYLNVSYLHDEQSREDFRSFIGSLQARHGIYAVWGNTDVPTWRSELFTGLGVNVLEDELAIVEVEGQVINLLGIDMRRHFVPNFTADRTTLRQLAAGMPDEGFNVLLYHTPDLMPDVVATGQFDLYLAGHTHGGQIRLPFYGALVTASRHGKQYEAGLFQEGRTRLYVNRGLGLEGGSAPRVRFLCRPEITLFTLSGRNGPD